MSCTHLNFRAQVKVARLEDSGQFMADITVQCQDCGKPFQFLGLEPGLDTQGARVSVDGLEARIGICPQDARPTPVQRMAHGIRKFEA
jgi:hypothetical protein